MNHIGDNNGAVANAHGHYRNAPPMSSGKPNRRKKREDYHDGGSHTNNYRTGSRNGSGRDYHNYTSDRRDSDKKEETFDLRSSAFPPLPIAGSDNLGALTESKEAKDAKSNDKM